MSRSRGARLFALAAGLLGALGLAVSARAQPAPADVLAPRFALVEAGSARLDGVVMGVRRDGAGFLWVATQQGLLRYDGARVRPFAVSDGLADPYVLTLAFDPRVPGAVWVGTRTGGLFGYDPGRDRLAPVPLGPGGEEVRAVAVDRDGVRWVGTAGRGLRRLAPGADAAEVVRGLPSDSVRALLADAGGTLWVGTTRGLARVGADGGAIPLIGAPVAALAEAAGAVWAGTATGALLRIRAGEAAPRPVADAGAEVAALAPSRAWPGRLWVGTRGRGLLLLDPASGALRPLDGAPAHVLGVDEDAEGSLWLATPEGLFRADLGGPRFPAVRLGDGGRGTGVMALHADPRDPGAVWAGTIGTGLWRVGPGGAMRRYLAGWRNPVFALHPAAGVPGEDGGLWVGSTRPVLHLLDLAGGDTRPFALAPGERGYVKQLYAAPSAPGVLWVATDAHGLVEFDGAARAVRRRFHTAGPPGARLGSDDVWAVLEAPGEPGVLWVGTHDAGLHRLDVARGAVAPVRVREGAAACELDGRVVSLAATPGVLWLGTFDAGLVRYDRRAGTCRRYTRDDGLPADGAAEAGIGAIYPDARGHLWLSTNGGLVRFDPAREAFTRFDESDGLPGTFFYFHAHHRAPDGTLLLGGGGGYTRFRPEAVPVDTAGPRTVITRVLVDGRPVALARDAEGRVLPLRLRYDQRDVAVEYAALDLRAPARTRYRVRLVGADAGWRAVGGRTEERYPALAPGRYTFEVAGTNRDGYWSAAPAALALVIRPPFWRTAPFWALLAGLGLAAVAGAYQLRIRQLLRLERTRRRIADDLHDDIGSKMSSVALRLDLAGRSPALPDDERARLAELSATARAVVTDLRDAVWFVDAAHDDLPALVARMEQVAGQLLAGRPHTFTPPDDVPPRALAMETRRHLYLLYKEALHNAVRHGCDGRPDGRVDVRLALDGARLTLAVTDDGPGLGAASGAAGSGRGLRTMRDRAEAIGGALTVGPAPGGGTAVRLVVDLDRQPAP